MTNSNILRQLSACLAVSGQYQELEDLAANYPDNPDILFYRSVANVRKGDIDKALEELKKILHKNPGCEPAKKLVLELLIYEASKHAGQNNWKEMSLFLTDALKMVSEIPEMQKKLSDFKNTLPISLIQTGDRAEAARIWEDELRKDSSNPILIHSLALLYYWWAVHEEEESRKEYEALKKTSTDGGEALHREGEEKTPGEAAVKTRESGGNRSDGLWEKAIAYWTLLLNTDEFWTWYKKDREQAWGIDIDRDDIEDIRDQFRYKRLSGLFESYQDSYSQASQNEDASRHKNYSSLLSVERRTARLWKDALSLANKQFKIETDRGVKRYEFVRSIQESMGSEVCFGTETNCEKPGSCVWKPDCASVRNQNVCLNHASGYLLHEIRGSFLDACYLAEALHRNNPKNTKLAQLRLFFSPKKLGRLYGYLEDGQNPGPLLQILDGLPENVKQSMEGTYLRLSALQETGRMSFDNGDYEGAFTRWLEVKNLFNSPELKKEAQSQFLDEFFQAFWKGFRESVVTRCEEASKKLKKQKKTDQVISILENGVTLTRSKSLKELLAVFYVQEGQDNNRRELFQKARDKFKKALALLPDHKGAKDGIAMAYNNEASKKTNADVALSLYKKAFEYNPGNKVLQTNLAGAYNRKAVDMLNSLSPHSFTIRNDVDEAIDLLRTGLAVLNPALMNIDKFNLMRAAEVYAIGKGKEGELFSLLVKNLQQAYEIKDKLKSVF
jgi:tetratricopeptide (TPR) repeat protein